MVVELGVVGFDAIEKEVGGLGEKGIDGERERLEVRG